MSRPFSYNDENFTIIGNILFFHIKVTKEIKQYDNIIEIPPEIYKRMVNKGTLLMCVPELDELSTSYWVNAGVSKNLPNGKCYIYVGGDINSIGNYLIGYYILRDI